MNDDRMMRDRLPPRSTASVAYDAAFDDDFEDFYRPESAPRPRSTRRVSSQNRPDDGPPNSRGDFAESAVRSRARSSRARESMLRDFDEDFEEAGEESSNDSRDHADPRSRRRVPLSRNVRRTSFLATKWGRIGAGLAAVATIAVLASVFMLVRGFFLHDPRFLLQGASSVQIQGINEISRAEVLGVFNTDLNRNIFLIPLAARRSSLQQLPWVQRATVMRLMPDQLRISIVERTPTAFLRQGSQIDLVDATGTILSMSPAMLASRHYSFPVVVGINPDDPPQTRAERMQLYQNFVSALDSTGTAGATSSTTTSRVSQQLSEVDVSDPEDIRALMPSAGADILVHFGEESFAKRYRLYQQHLAQWRQQYPHLAAIDLRYDRQTVLEMAKGAASDPLNGDKVDTMPTLAATSTIKSAGKTSASRISHRPVVHRSVHSTKAPTHPAKPAAKTGIKVRKPVHPAARSNQHAASSRSVD